MPTQEEVGDWLGLDQSQVSRRLAEMHLDAATSDMRTIVRAYCAALREVAAGRSLDLVKERARLAAEQADKVAMDNAIRRRDLAPVGLLTAALANVSRQLVAVIDLIPVQIRRQVSGIEPKVLAIIEDQLTIARTAAARIELADNFADEPDAPEGSGGGGAIGPDSEATTFAVAMGV